MSKKQIFILLLLGLLGASIVLLATAHYGVGISNDSAGYIAAAQHIASGMGATIENGTDMTVWPPLYPAALACIDMVNATDPMSAARFFNAILFGLIIYMSGLLHFKYLKQSATYAILGTTFLLISTPLFEHFLWALSESFFIFFVLLYLFFIESYLEKGHTRTLVYLSLSVGLACLTRYIGVILIFTGCLSILFFHRDHSKIKTRHLLIFISISALPISLWLFRNYFVSGTFFGERAQSLYTLPENISFLVKSIQYWYFPDKMIDHPLILFLIVVIITSMVIVLIKSSSRQDFRLFFIESRSLLLLIFVYISFLLFSSTHIAYDKIGNRLLSPIYIPILILTLLFIFHSHQLIITLTKPWISRKVVDILLVSTIAIWSLYPAMSAFVIVKRIMNNGEGYNSITWRNSQTMAYLAQNKKLPSGCALYSNAPEAVYVRTHLVNERSPRKTWYNSPQIANTIDDLKGKWPKENNTCLAWFINHDAPSLFSLGELNGIAKLHILKEFDDGVIYSVTRQ